MAANSSSGTRAASSMMQRVTPEYPLVGAVCSIWASPKGCDQIRPSGGAAAFQLLRSLGIGDDGKGGLVHSSAKRAEPRSSHSIGLGVTLGPLGNVTVTNDPRRRRERLSVVGGYDLRQNRHSLLRPVTSIFALVFRPLRAFLRRLGCNFRARVCVTSFFMPLMVRATFILFGSPLNNLHPIFVASDASVALGRASIRASSLSSS
jgi:hypothetical protein